MSRKFLISVMSVGSALAISLSAFAEDPIGYMGNFSGQTFIKHDGIIYSAAPRAALYPGDEIVTVNGSKAVITFSSGCSFDLNENSLVLLVSQDQCGSASKVIPLDTNSPYYGYTFSSSNGALTTGASTTGGLESGAGVLIPVTLVAGAGLVAAAVSGKDDNTVNSSP